MTTSTSSGHPLDIGQIVERLPRRYSPSGMGQFVKCPLSFYYRYVLGIRGDKTAAMTLGTLCHSVLEDLFDLEPDERTAEAARSMIDSSWAGMLAEDADYLDVVGDAAAVKTFLAQAAALIDNYFTIETPSGFTPVARELDLEATLDGVTYRGIIDRLDTIVVGGEPTNVISDYKSGRRPKAAYEDDAFFAMRVYALLVAETTGEVPSALRLVYISQRTKANGLIRRRVDDQMLDATRTRISRIVDGVFDSADRRHFVAKQSALCNWCDYQTFCPARNPELAGVPHEQEVAILTGASA